MPVTFRNVVLDYRKIGTGFVTSVKFSAATKEEYFEDKTNTVTLDGECGGHT